MIPAQIPASWVAANAGLPAVCSRHGEPAAGHRRVKLISRTPGWCYVLLLAGVLPYFIVTAILRRMVKAPAWPFCARCRRRRLWFAVGAGGLFGLTVVLFCTAAAMAPSGGDPPSLLVVSLFMAFLGGVAMATLAGGPSLAGAELSEDGWWVRVKRAHPVFAEQAAAALRAAHAATAQMWASPGA